MWMGFYIALHSRKVMCMRESYFSESQKNNFVKIVKILKIQGD